MEKGVRGKEFPKCETCGKRVFRQVKGQLYFCTARCASMSNHKYELGWHLSDKGLKLYQQIQHALS